MQRLLTLVYCFFLFNSTAEAQPVVNSHLQEYTTENGLPSNGIKGMQWDEKTEFLWMATEAGIVRFNGVDFRSFTSENMPAIASERILFMTRNNSGAIYVSDDAGNIFSISGSKPILWKAGDKNSSAYYSHYYLLPVSDIFFKKQAGLVAGSSRLSAITSRVVPLSDTSCLILDAGTLYYQSIGLNKAVRLPLEKDVLLIAFKIGKHSFITNHRKETFLFNSVDQSFSRVAVTDETGRPIDAKVNSAHLFWEPGMQKPVFVEGGQASIMEYENNTIVAKLAFTGIPSDAYIRSVLYSEKNKILFIGTDSKGLMVVNQNRVRSMKRFGIKSGNRNSYYSQIELPGGSVLTNEGDIIGGAAVDTTNLPVTGKFMFNITNTGDSLLWYDKEVPQFRYACLHSFNKFTRKTTVYPKIIGNNVVATSNNKIYVANHFGFALLDYDSLMYVYKYPGGRGSIITFDFKEISPGVLAAATCNALLRFQISTGKLDTLFTKPRACVRSIWQYKEYIFFGTYGAGFFIYKNGHVKAMPLDKNKYLLYTHCFVPDDKGYCWISTNRGLFKANLDELVNVFEKNTNTAYYHYFGKKDGMEMTELNGGCTPCALKLRNNNFSFPTMDGLLWVDPEKAMPVLPSGDIYIDDVLIDGENKDDHYLESTALPAGTKDIAIHLAFSAWCNKENIYLEYQLDDTINWKPVNFENGATIAFSNLPPGKYNLKVRKLKGFGFNNYTYKDIAFSIIIPWYKQWWFYLILVLAVFGAIAGYLRIRTNQYRVRQQKLETQVAEKTKELQQKNEVLEKNNSIQTRLISIISHDIVTPLKFLTVAGKNLLDKRELMPEALQDETIREMTNTSQELQLLSTNILNWIKYQHENRRLVKEQFLLSEMIDQINGVLKSFAKQKNIELINNVAPETEVFQYFEAFKILVYNLVSNAINFSEAGQVTVSAEPGDIGIIVAVQDKGVGMTEEQIHNIMTDQFIVSSANIDKRKGNGLGYLIIKDLLKMMGATINIKSEKGSGSTVLINVPQ